MSTAGMIVRAGILLLWLVSPLLLTLAALRDWRRKRGSAGLRMLLPLALGTTLLADWALFVYFLIRSETPYGAYYKTSWSTAVLLLLAFLVLVMSRVAPAAKWQLSVGGALLLGLWVCIGYAPAHWLARVDFGSASASVDGHPVAVSVYFGHPTDSEAEAIVLVRLQDGGDYFLDLGSEKVRQASRSEYVRLVGGMWCFRSMQNGPFVEPLTPTKLDEFRIRSRDGHLITVKF